MSKFLSQNIFLFLILAGGNVFSQAIVQSPNIPVAGDVWGNKTITDTTIQAGPGGTNQVWNFGSFFVNPSVISEAYTIPAGSGNDALFPTSNLKATSLFGGDDYYYRSSTQLQYLGYKDQSVELVISNSQRLIDVPLQYGDTIMNVPVTGTGVFGYPLSGTIGVEADGTGNLTLYTGSFQNVLRVVTTMNLIIGAGTGIDTYVNIKKYTWYSPLYRAPIFQIATMDVSGNLASVNKKVVTVSLLTSDVSNVNGDLNFKISPNPASVSTKISFDRSGSVSEIFICDLTGKIQRRTEIRPGTDNALIDISDLAKGVYIVTVSQNEKTSRQQLVLN